MSFANCRELLSLLLGLTQALKPYKSQRLEILSFLGVISPNSRFSRRFLHRKLKMEAEDTTQVYHERQRLQYCLLHALNNLFQEKDLFTRAKLNAIAEKLSLDDPNKETWTPLSVLFKPHHNVITGNYDINVLIAALEGRGKNVIWHDRRYGASSIDLDGAEDTLMGIMLNISVRRFGGIWNGRHWFTLRRIGGVWYNLDSDLKSPQTFKDVEEVKTFLDCIIDGGGEILLVKNCKE